MWAALTWRASIRTAGEHVTSGGWHVFKSPATQAADATRTAGPGPKLLRHFTREPFSGMAGWILARRAEQIDEPSPSLDPAVLARSGLPPDGELSLIAA